MSLKQQSASDVPTVEKKSAPSESHLPDHHWPIETFILKLGKGPAAASRWLNRAAANPDHTFLGGVLSLVVKFFSSIWLGLLWLFLTGAYVAIGSGFANIRADLEMTDMQFFDAWPMVTLMILVLVGITVVTLRRIPLTLFKLGSWTVHVGIVTLIVGCFIYFGNKHEGSVRIFLNQSVDSYYDATERALYVNGPGKDQTVMIPLPELPIYHEHLNELGNGLSIEKTIGDYLPRPQFMSVLMNVVPVKSDGPPPADMRVRITGYYPYAIMREAWEGDTSESQDSGASAGSPGVKTPGLQVNPAIQTRISVGTVSRTEWLVASSPAARVLDTANAPLGIEYLYQPDAAVRADISRPIDGPLGITVRIPKLKIEQAFKVQEGQTIKVDGSPYTLTIGGVSSLPLVSKGYEGANSSAIMVKVVRDDGEKKTEFERMALFRYPERSPDFINVNGQQKRVQDRVDNDIQITFQDATRDQFWFVQDGGNFTLINRAAGGKVSQSAIKPGQAAQVNVNGMALQLSLISATQHAVRVQRPILIPERQRPRASTVMERVSNSVIEVELSQGNWKKQVYVPFVQFANMQGPPLGTEPAKVELPGYGELKIILSTTRRALPSSVKLVKFEAIKYPGAARSFADYRSTLEATPKSGGPAQTLVTQLNAPAADAELYYFQAAWDGDENAKPADRFSVIGVGNRPGIHVMVAGAVLMALGVMFAFYIKPILIRVKKKELTGAEALQKVKRRMKIIRIILRLCGMAA